MSDGLGANRLHSDYPTSMRSSSALLPAKCMGSFRSLCSIQRLRSRVLVSTGHACPLCHRWRSQAAVNIVLSDSFMFTNPLCRRPYRPVAHVTALPPE